MNATRRILRRAMHGPAIAPVAYAMPARRMRGPDLGMLVETTSPGFVSPREAQEIERSQKCEREEDRQ